MNKGEKELMSTEGNGRVGGKSGSPRKRRSSIEYT